MEVLRLLSTVPADGVYSPTNTFKRVDLPVPLYPISPMRSPECICQVASFTMVLAPNSNVTFCKPASIRAANIITDYTDGERISPIKRYYQNFSVGERKTRN